MSHFLQDTAQKEAVGRKKLEDFIEGLFERTEVAEQSVQHMRRSLVMSQEGLDAPTSLPALTVASSRHTLPGTTRGRQVSLSAQHVYIYTANVDILAKAQQCSTESLLV